jgi:hypothetical protein
MIKQDYILRLIKEFSDALQRILDKPGTERRKEAIRQLYEQYVGPYSFYAVASIDELMKAFEGMEMEQRLCKMQMLAELYFTESALMSKPIGDMMLEKAYALYDYIEQNGDTFSIVRQQKMREIEQKLKTVME